MSEKLSIAQAAKAAGVSSASARNWLKTEKQLAKLARKRKGRTYLKPEAVSVLKKVATKRRAKASPALKAAWAAKTAQARAKAAEPAWLEPVEPAELQALTLAQPRRSARHRVASLDAVAGELEDALNAAVATSNAKARAIVIRTLQAQRDLTLRALTELARLK